MSVKKFYCDDGVELIVSPSFAGAGAMGHLPGIFNSLSDEQKRQALGYTGPEDIGFMDDLMDELSEVCPLWPSYPCKCHPAKGSIEPEKEDEWR